MLGFRCPRLCGRDGELAVLAESVRRGGMVVLTGPAGIGKSRLVGEAVGLAERDGAVSAMGRASPALGAQPYTPIRNALLSAIRDQQLPDDEAFATWRTPLDAVLQGHGANAKTVEIQPALVGEAVLQLLARLPSPVVMVLEDLHWADQDTIAVLDYVADSAAGRRTAWLLTAREAPEFTDRLRERRSVTHLRLAPLPPAAVSEMVGACAPGGDRDEVLARVQRFSDGVPLFVEELIASPGIPESFAEAVRSRWRELGAADREVLAAAAVLGRDISVELVRGIVDRSADEVAGSLRAGLEAGLVERRGGEPRFRHALTREALLEALLPQARQQLAGTALEVITTARPDGWQGLAAEVARSAGDRRCAGRLLTLAGKSALDRGTLATAVDSLRRAVELSDGTDDDARLALVRALSTAGEVDLALAEGETLLAAGTMRAGDVRVLLAEAAARGARWPLAAKHLAGVGDVPELADRVAILSAEIAFAGGHTSGAREQVTELVQRKPADPAIRARAQILLGRIDRLADLTSAQESFERALAIATAARLPVHALDALHELGTIELLDFAGTARLLQARETATQVGAMGTRAVVDLQLAAAYLGRFETDAAERHAGSAYEIADRLGLHAVATKALLGLAETCVQRLKPDEMEHLLGLALARDRADTGTEAFAWGQCRGLLAMFENDWARALACLERGVALLKHVANPEPVEYRALWPLLLAGEGDERAAGALAEAGTGNLTTAFANRGFLGYAEAILAGSAGDRTGAAELSLRADAYLVRFPVWAHLARVCAAPVAERDGWGQPRRWLAAAAPAFAAAGWDALAARCRPLPSPRATEAITDRVTEREAEVLALLQTGLANKQIAARLHLSPRTVEKHIESLLRKSGRRSRTQLALWAVGRTT